MRHSWLAIVCIILAFGLSSCKETGGGTLSGSGDGSGGILDATGTERLTEVNNPADDELSPAKAHTFYDGQVTIWYPGKGWTVEGDDDDAIFSSEGEQIVASVSERAAPKDPVDDATFIQGVYAGIPLEATAAEGFDQAWQATVPDGAIERFYFVATKRIAEDIAVTLQMTGSLLPSSAFHNAFKTRGQFILSKCFSALKNNLYLEECQFRTESAQQAMEASFGHGETAAEFVQKEIQKKWGRIESLVSKYSVDEKEESPKSTGAQALPLGVPCTDGSCDKF